MKEQPSEIQKQVIDSFVEKMKEDKLPDSLIRRFKAVLVDDYDSSEVSLRKALFPEDTSI